MKKGNGKRVLGLITGIVMILQIFISGICSMDVYASNINEFIRDKHISEENYDYEMTNVVEPYIDSIKSTGYITGVDDESLYYEEYLVENAKANIVISHGYTENLEKYNEMIYYFIENNYNVFGIEHRGHGRSGSLGIADKTQIHVESFEDYITDLKIFMDEIVVPHSEDKPLLLYAHSMGGGIGAKFLEEYPEYFDQAILSSPMLEINSGKIPSAVGRFIAKCAVILGKGGDYVMGMSSYNPEFDPETIGTSSINRYMHSRSFVWDNEELQRGEASYKWTYESLKATKEIVKKKNASKVEIPVLLFQAGNDTYVRSNGQDKFAQYAKNCTIKYFANSRHEIYMETDEIQKAYLKNVLEFYENAVTSEENVDENTEQS